MKFALVVLILWVKVYRGSCQFESSTSAPEIQPIQPNRDCVLNIHRTGPLPIELLFMPIVWLKIGKYPMTIHVTGSYRSNFTVIDPEPNSISPSVKVNFSLDFPEVNLETELSASGYINSDALSGYWRMIPSGNFDGRAKIDFQAKAVSIVGSMSLFENRRSLGAVVTKLDIDTLKFDDFTINMNANVTLGEFPFPISWSGIRRHFENITLSNFEKNYKNILRYVMVAMNKIIEGFSLSELEEMNNNGCPLSAVVNRFLGPEPLAMIISEPKNSEDRLLSQLRNGDFE